MSCRPTYDPCLDGKLNQIGSYASVARQSAESATASATQSAASAASAQSNATLVQNLYDDFSDKYLGSFDTPPLPPITEGALYYNTVSNVLFVWNGTTWVSADFNEFTNFTATGSTTARSLVNRFADVVNVLNFGADNTGGVDSTPAFNDAIATGKPVFVPFGTYKTDGVVTNPRRIVSSGATFTGTNTIDPYPAFGEGAFKVYATNNNNCIIGIVDNNNPPATFGFPTGVTGYGRNNNSGNTAFGIYAEARQYANTGVVTNEIDSFNHGAAPSSNLPPDRSIGTSQQVPVALTIAAGGTANSSIGIDIAREGSSPQSFLTGIYINSNAVVNYGIFIDSTNTSTHEPLVVKHSVSTIGIRIRGVGIPVANNAFFTYEDGSGSSVFSIRQDGRIGIDSSALQQNTVGTAGAASVLPSNPTGYFKIIVGGFTKVVPYYEP